MERAEFEAIIKEINDAKCSSIHAVDECTKFYESKPELVASGLDPDKHRWYEITTNVYRAGEWFLGITGVSQMYSESSSWSDVDIDTVAFEMEQVPCVTYREKKNQSLGRSIMNDEILGLLREARALLLIERTTLAGGNSRELSVTLTEIDTAILWRQHDLQMKEEDLVIPFLHVPEIDFGNINNGTK